MRSVTLLSGVSCLAAVLALVLVLHDKVLLVPFVVLTALYVVLFYAVLVRRIVQKWAYTITAVIMVPVVVFVYTSKNSLWFWASYALALVASMGVTLLVSVKKI